MKKMHKLLLTPQFSFQESCLFPCNVFLIHIIKVEFSWKNVFFGSHLVLGWNYYIFSFTYMGKSSDCSQSGNKQHCVRFWAGYANSKLVFRLKSSGAVCLRGPLLRDRMPFAEVGQYSKEAVGTLWWSVSRDWERRYKQRADSKI